MADISGVAAAEAGGAVSAPRASVPSPAPVSGPEPSPVGKRGESTPELGDSAFDTPGAQFGEAPRARLQFDRELNRPIIEVLDRQGHVLARFPPEAAKHIIEVVGEALGEQSGVLVDRQI